ncbi:MAG: hypothetical protein KAI66_23750, partial [Lentisphaeria bacterium]|nr:hypothetical protein [Lentisphaeria bacterium]
MTCSRLVLAAFLVVSCVTAAPTAPPRPGRDCKIRILVDKVMLPVEKWVTREWIVKETADAGFNVFSPRL